MILEAQAKGDKAPAAYRPPLSTWSAEVERLTMIVDQLAGLQTALINVNGGHMQPPKPQPRPHTALERAGQRQALAKHESLVARVRAAQKAAAEAATEARTVE